MTDWENSKECGAKGSSSQYSEMPIYGGDDEGPPAPLTPREQEAEVTESAPSEGIPTERLGEWVTTGWTVLRANLGEFVVAQLLVSVLLLSTAGLLIGPLTAGYFRYGLKRLRGESVETNELFSAFKGESIGGPLVAGLGALVVLVLLSSVGAAAALFLGLVPQVGPSLEVVVQLVVVLASAGVWGSWSLLPALMHERGLQLVPAWARFWSLLSADWAGVLVLGLAIGIFPVLGAMLLGVGVLVGGPLGLLIGAQAFDEIFGASGKSRRNGHGGR